MVMNEPNVIFQDSPHTNRYCIKHSSKKWLSKLMSVNLFYVGDDCPRKNRIIKNPSVASCIRCVINCATRCGCVRNYIKVLILATPITRILHNVGEDSFVDPVCFVLWIDGIIATVYKTPAHAYIKIKIKIIPRADVYRIQAKPFPYRNVTCEPEQLRRRCK